MPKLVIIGGSDAGISAALRARELDPSVAVMVVVADAFPNYSICGLPFYLSGETLDWHMLAHRTADEITAQGITMLLNHTARRIEPTQRQVVVEDVHGRSHALDYDRLIVATGAESQRPDIAGLDAPGVYLLHTMADSFAVHARLAALDEQQATTRRLLSRRPRAAIVGGGYIGLELADAFRHRGLDVTLIQRGPTPLNTVEPEMGARIADEMRRHGVEVILGATIGSIVATGAKGDREDDPYTAPFFVEGAHDDGAWVSVAADIVVAPTGVRPVTQLARDAGCALGVGGALAVTRTMATNVPAIYAAGDCVETWSHLLERSIYLPLGTTAHKQGRIAGENAVRSLRSEAGGGAAEPRQFAGTLGTQVVKVFDLAIARTGLTEAEARAAGFDAVATEITTWDHKAYYPGAQPLTLRVTGDRTTGRLLGASIIGHWKAEVAKRIDIYATALFHRMRVADLSDLDLSYTPPLSSPWDPVQMAAQAWAREWGL